jgi:GH24 family phage-related lysozyme (muramidase)
MQIKGMSYCQWQKRNSNTFNELPKQQQQEAREQGYYNVGWEKVQRSWQVLQELQRQTPARSLFAAKLSKGDVVGAMEQSILTAEKAQTLAKQTLKDLNRRRKGVKKLAETTLNKYQLL